MFPLTARNSLNAQPSGLMTKGMSVSKYRITNDEGYFTFDEQAHVLANKLNIIDAEEINGVELILLEKLYVHVFEQHFPRGKITIALLKRWHLQWLGNIYTWAEKIRTVNLSKSNFLFAAAARLPFLLRGFENQFLAKYTPCSGMTREQTIRAIAAVHVELIIIHPFREGNGRLARLLADVMAVQAGFAPLDYHAWEKKKDQYITAIHAGMNMEYGLMEELVNEAIRND